MKNRTLIYTVLVATFLLSWSKGALAFRCGIAATGSCGRGNLGTSMALNNPDPNATYKVTVRVGWQKGTKTGEDDKVYTVPAGGRVPLGCTKGPEVGAGQYGTDYSYTMVGEINLSSGNVPPGGSSPSSPAKPRGGGSSSYPAELTSSSFQKSPGTGVYEGAVQFQGDIDKDGTTDLIFMSPSWVWIHYSTSDYKINTDSRQSILLHENPDWDKTQPGAYAGCTYGIKDMDGDGNFDLVFNCATVIAYLRGLGNRQFNAPALRSVIEK